MASADEHIIRVRVQIGIKLRVRKGAGVYICGAVPAIQQIGSAVGQRRGMIMPCIRNPTSAARGLTTSVNVVVRSVTLCVAVTVADVYAVVLAVNFPVKPFKVT